MFGLSRDTERRMEAMERTASEARDIGRDAISKIERHAGECNVREQNRQDWQRDVNNTLRWQTRYAIGILLTALGAILMEIARAKGLF